MRSLARIFTSPDRSSGAGQLEDEAGKLYDAQANQHVRRALRALRSLRMAIEARLDTKRPGDGLGCR
jgi:hypothetical protein